MNKKLDNKYKLVGRAAFQSNLKGAWTSVGKIYLEGAKVEGTQYQKEKNSPP